MIFFFVGNNRGVAFITVLGKRESSKFMKRAAGCVFKSQKIVMLYVYSTHINDPVCGEHHLLMTRLWFHNTGAVSSRLWRRKVLVCTRRGELTAEGEGVTRGGERWRWKERDLEPRGYIPFTVSGSTFYSLFFVCFFTGVACFCISVYQFTRYKNL